MLHGLDVFSGIGGISLALSEWVKPVAYCEIEPYCQSVLLQRMQEGHLSKAPIWDDVRTLPTHELPRIDIIYGGFPCQDISIAGRGKGLEGQQSGLFFEIMRLAEEIKPQFLFLENVPAITTRGGLQVVREIAKRWYDCRWCTLSASEVGALHKRERWFLLADSNSARLQKEGAEQQTTGSQYSGFISDSDSEIGSGLRSREEARQPIVGMCGQYSTVYEWQEVVSSVCRITYGIPHRVDRIKALGNAVVPCQAREAFMRLSGIKTSNNTTS